MKISKNFISFEKYFAYVICDIQIFDQKFGKNPNSDMNNPKNFNFLIRKHAESSSWSCPKIMPKVKHADGKHSPWACLKLSMPMGNIPHDHA
jgi:hypothetical protein